MSARVARAVLVVAASLATAGCSESIFDRPVIVSSVASAVPEDAPRLGVVRAEQCETIYYVIPVASGPKEPYVALFDQARALGGDALVDIQARKRRSTAVFPLYIRGCWELTATAVRVAPTP
jgi:hypothetical protein